MEYYYTDPQNQPRGPVTLAELQELTGQGAVHPYTMVAQVGSQQWVPIGTVLPGLVPFAPQPTEPLAIWSICLSVAGMSCYGLTAIGGVICGHMALSNLKKKPNFQGRGIAIAGLIIGYLMLLILVAAIGFFVFIAIMSASQSH